MEFSCPAASTQHYLELPSRIYRFTRHLRGQLQRQVMTTIRQMAWPVRINCTAHATEPTPGHSLSVPNLRAARRPSSECSCPSQPGTTHAREHPIPADFSHAISAPHHPPVLPILYRSQLLPFPPFPWRGRPNPRRDEPWRCFQALSS
jgi:hypothetical protein